MISNVGCISSVKLDGKEIHYLPFTCWNLCQQFQHTTLMIKKAFGLFGYTITVWPKQQKPESVNTVQTKTSCKDTTQHITEKMKKCIFRKYFQKLQII